MVISLVIMRYFGIFIVLVHNVFCSVFVHGTFLIMYCDTVLTSRIFLTRVCCFFMMSEYIHLCHHGYCFAVHLLRSRDSIHTNKKQKYLKPLSTCSFVDLIYFVSFTLFILHYIAAVISISFKSVRSASICSLAISRASFSMH